jgi:hypothetical protein
LSRINFYLNPGSNTCATRPVAHGTGAVQAGTPQIPASNLTARGLLKQQAAFNQLRKMQPKRNH